VRLKEFLLGGADSRSDFAALRPSKISRPATSASANSSPPWTTPSPAWSRRTTRRAATGRRARSGDLGPGRGGVDRPFRALPPARAHGRHARRADPGIGRSGRALPDMRQPGPQRIANNREPFPNALRDSVRESSRFGSGAQSRHERRHVSPSCRHSCRYSSPAR
jgi:hypothetical protein